MKKKIEQEMILSQCEAVVEVGFDSILRTARALEIIKNRELYKDGYESFGDYCKDKFQLEKSDVISFMGLLSSNSTQKKGN